MTHLRKKMLEELKRRNYSQLTTKAYLRTVGEFALYFHRTEGVPQKVGFHAIGHCVVTIDMLLISAKRSELEANGIKAATSFVGPNSYRVHEVIRKPVRKRVAGRTL